MNRGVSPRFRLAAGVALAPAGLPIGLGAIVADQRLNVGFREPFGLAPVLLGAGLDRRDVGQFLGFLGSSRNFAILAGTPGLCGPSRAIFSTIALRSSRTFS